MVLHQGEEFSGIVVSKRDYKERDLLVKILTNRYGYKTFYIRGAKKRGFRLGAIILPFSHGRYLGSINDDGLSYLSTGKEIDQYQNIFNDIMLNAYASYVLGLGEAAIKDDCILASQWYRKIERALQLIDQGVNPLIIVSIMEIQMLELFGVAPEWRFCAVCSALLLTIPKVMEEFFAKIIGTLIKIGCILTKKRCTSCAICLILIWTFWKASILAKKRA